MAEINKPDMTNLWASGGAVIAPAPIKVQTGWTAEIPPHQWENWVQRRQDEAIAYLFQRGIAEWDSTTEYFANESVVLHQGVIYIANGNNTGSEPNLVSEDWRTLFSDAPTASETERGFIQLATVEQAQALIDDSRALTPKKLADAFSGSNRGMGSSGFQRFPGGAILNRGSVQVPGGGAAVTVTLPLAFSQGSGTVAICRSAETTQQIENMILTVESRPTQLIFRSSATSSGTHSYHWLAFGF